MGAVQQGTPRVTLGVPVFNGARFLADALDSLLGQTFTDLELIIADNASTDDTERIARAYAERDARIRYVRHRRNLGAPANWNYLARVARGQYFKWASANDTCSPHMLAECVAALDAEPLVVLCYGHTVLVDETGDVAVYKQDIDVGEARPSERFAKVCAHMAMNNAQSGVIRHDALLRTGLDRLYPGGDMVLMAELALLGHFRLLPGVHLHRRTGKGTMTTRLTPDELTRFLQPAARTPFRMRTARRHFDYLTTVLSSPIPMREKVPAALGALRRAAWARSKILAEIRSLIAS